MSNTDAIAFAEKNLPNFNIRKGWHRLVRDMLVEFYEAGWDPSIKVFGKEKFGGLRCYSISGNADTDKKLNTIVNKYARLSEKTCELCGREAKHRSVRGWEETLCFDHYKESCPTIEVYGKTLIVGMHLFKIRKFKRAEILPDFRSVIFYTHTFFFAYKQSVSFSHQQPNFYRMLRTIPLSIFSNADAQYIERLFGNLSYCEVCGRTAIFEKHCLYCYYIPWELCSDQFAYIDKNDYIKSCQMHNTFDRYDDMKIMEEDRSFDKYPEHQILFTPEEFEEYKQDLFDEDE